MTINHTYLNPVAIGGLGGSGTRLVAAVLKHAGFYLGDFLNKSLDNLWFSFLFNRIESATISNIEFHDLAEIFLNAMFKRNKLTNKQLFLIHALSSEQRGRFEKKWIKRGANSILSVVGHPHAFINSWGWKEPNTHLLIDKWIALLPQMKYIHIIRNGLDMSFSKNKNQFDLWGSYLLGQENIPATPKYYLKFWCAIHRRLLQMKDLTVDNFYLLRYEDFCKDPWQSIDALFRFLNITLSNSKISTLKAMVNPTDTIGRHRRHPIEQFDQDDINFIKSMGYGTTREC